MVSAQKYRILFYTLEVLGFSTLLVFLMGLSWDFLSSLFGENNFLMNFLYFLIRAVVVLFLSYGLRKLLGQWTWQDLGFKIHRRWKKDIWFGFIVYAVVHILMMPIYYVAILPAGAEQMQSQMGGMLQMPILQLMLVVTVGASIWGFLTGALNEEVAYRGYIQGLFSKAVAPSTGLLLALIPFVASHYFSHPEWNLLLILNTLPSGFAFAVAYYATGSLFVPITAHALMNWIPFYGVVLYAKGYIHETNILMLSLGICFLIICLIGRKEIKTLILKTKELFIDSSWRMTLLGIVIGLIYVAVMWGQYVLNAHVHRMVYLSILASFAVICIGLSYLNKLKNRER